MTGAGVSAPVAGDGGLDGVELMFSPTCDSVCEIFAGTARCGSCRSLISR